MMRATVPSRHRICLVKKYLIICVAPFFLLSCGEEQQQVKTPPPAVSVFKVEMQPVGRYREFVARTEASKEVELRARVEGEIIARHFTEGGYVEKGSLLFELDPAPYQATLNQAEAEVVATEAELTKAAADYKRAEELSPQGFISTSDLDKLKSAKVTAESAVSAAKANLEKAQLNLGYTKITAPFSGLIGKENYSVGNLVGPASGPLAVLTSNDPLYVNFQIEEQTFITYLLNRGGDNRSETPPIDITMRLPNNETYSEMGTLDFSDTKVDSSVGSVTLRAVFPNPEGVILPGLFVNIILESQEKNMTALVPQSAVQENQLGKYVLVVGDDNKVTQRIVKIGQRIDAMWVVESGIEPGEMIIVEGLQKVRPDVEVNPVEKFVDAKTGVLSDARPE